MKPAIRYQPRYTLADYLGWEGDWELWDGHPVSMSPSPRFRHQEVARRLVVELDRALQRDEACADCHLVYEIDWHVDQCTVVRPDVLILCGDPPDDFVKRPPAFIAEILSPSTADKDRIHKRALYEAQGVAHYLLVDSESQAHELLTLDTAGAYQPAGAEKITLHEHCELTIDPSRFCR